MIIWELLEQFQAFIGIDFNNPIYDPLVSAAIYLVAIIFWTGPLYTKMGLDSTARSNKHYKHLAWWFLFYSTLTIWGMIPLLFIMRGECRKVTRARQLERYKELEEEHRKMVEEMERSMSAVEKANKILEDK